MATLYVETNFLMSIATGQDVDAPRLLDLSPPHQLSIPGICLMEALSAVQGKRNRHNDFGNVLVNWSREIRRDRTSAAAATLLQDIEGARFQVSRLIDDTQARMVSAIERLCAMALVIPIDPAGVVRSLQTRHISQPTDNLILHTILTDARSRTGRKAVLTANTQDFGEPVIRSLLKSVDIDGPHGTATGALGWLSAATD